MKINQIKIPHPFVKGLKELVKEELSKKGYITVCEIKIFLKYPFVYKEDDYFGYTKEFNMVIADGVYDDICLRYIITDEPEFLLKDTMEEMMKHANEIAKERGMKPIMEKVIECPDHYVEGRKYEPRKVIMDWGLNFYLGNALKYISRAGRKNDAIEDLKKAKQYIDFEIERLEGEKKNV